MRVPPSDCVVCVRAGRPAAGPPRPGAAALAAAAHADRPSTTATGGEDQGYFGSCVASMDAKTRVRRILGFTTAETRKGVYRCLYLNNIGRLLVVSEVAGYCYRQPNCSKFVIHVLFSDKVFTMSISFSDDDS